ncbi:hypothetical protein I9W82_003692 [Candida metapsilosis]|uniref:Uncharacterized protein n=1 Tax=Candida metapsilosis TaxID=273372 RepID=A0A8H8DA78_9ASCO|nr:hypothetical protein I9W82_003692 [Candida metapsilosis]
MIVASQSTRKLNELMSSSIYNYLEQVETKEKHDQPEKSKEQKPQQIIPLYRRILCHPSLHSWIKWVIILHIVRLQNPIQWANFLSLNKPIRELLSYYQGTLSKLRSSHNKPSSCTLNKLTNFVTCVFLYFASVDMDQFPKDYALVSLLSVYHGELNPPSKSQILVSDSLSKPFKLSTYKSSRVYSPLMKIYQNKEYIIFPIFRINWKNLSRNYLLHNVVIAALVAGYSFKERILDRFYAIKYGHGKADSEASIFQNFAAYVFHKSNSITNLIYIPNLISIALIIASSPVFSILGSKRYPDLHRLYVLNQKSVFKTYTKVIGLIAGVIAIKLNYMQLVPDWGFNKKVEAEMTTTGYNVVYDEDVDEIPPARLLSKQFYNDLNMYLFKLVVLSKWRILKTYHPLFSKVQLPLWNKLETLLMCFGFLKMMNLNDYINEHKTPETERISRDSMIKMARFVSQ